MGKDDVFWDELEVNNLPDNYYLVKVIIKCIKLHIRNVVKVEQVGNKLVIKYHSSHGYCPAPNKRQKSNNDSNKEYLSWYLKNKLLIHIHKYFDQDKYYFTSFCDSLESQDLKPVFR